MFPDKKIARGEIQAVLWHKAGIFEAILGMQVAADSTVMMAKVFGGDQHQVVYFQADGEMGGILKLVASVAAEIGHMPAHTERSK